MATASDSKYRREAFEAAFACTYCNGTVTKHEPGCYLATLREHPAPVRVNAEDVKLAAAAWATPDDWGVASLYIDTLAELIDCLVAGAPVGELVAEAKTMSPGRAEWMKSADAMDTPVGERVHDLGQYGTDED